VYHVLCTSLAVALLTFVWTNPAAVAQQADLAGTDHESPDSNTTTEDESSQYETTSDTLTERQSIDAYTSLEDGQPGKPGHFELEFDVGWETLSGEHDPVLFAPELTFTLDGNEFLRNTQLILAVPMEFGLGGVDGNADIEFGWQQRWVQEDGWVPTLATLAEIRVPSGYHSSGVDGTLTGIVAKDFGPGTMFLNAFVKFANGNNVEDLRHFQWGVRTGYKWRLRDDFSLIADYVHRVSEEEGHANLNLLEVSGEWRVNEQLTIAPGIVVGLDDNEETPNFGAGVHMTWSF
jgi:hypothetical protein